MRSKLKVFIIYFPVVLVAFQVAINILSFIAPNFYYSIGFYLNTFFGTNMLFALFLLAFTHWFKFCEVSRWAAWAEVAFGINYLVVQQDNLYNILFQVIVGCIALMLTFRHYMRKFPLCRLSLLLTFVGSVVEKGSCKKGLEKWQDELRITIEKKHNASNSNNAYRH